MTEQNILKEPNPILKEISEDVKLPLSKEDRAIIDDMYSWLKENNDKAIGLAAVQIGVLKRMCVIKVPGVNYKLVNPRIIKHSKDFTFIPEGCLSVPEEIDTPVQRYANVIVSAYDAITNKNIIINAYGLLARCVQHEIDHMNGIEFTERLVK